MGIAIEKELTLILTASINPKGMPGASALSDPKLREDNYVEALNYYLTSHPRIRRIVFAENSGWPLERLRESALANGPQAEVEFLSFELNDFPRELGKSYGEMMLMDHATAASKLVASSAYCAKLTGRNFLKNITRLIECAPSPLDFYGDLRDHGFYEWLGTKMCGRHGESRFYVFAPDFYDRHFRGRYKDLNDSAGFMVENLIYQVVKQTMGHERVTPRFPIEPDFRGVAGHFNNKDYGSLRERGKRAIRATTRKIAPWLWI